MCPHSGMDIVSVPDTRVSMVVDGAVADAGWDLVNCGQTVILAHGDAWQTIDADLQLSDGIGPRLRHYDYMRRGDPIGVWGVPGHQWVPTFASKCGALAGASN